MKENSSFLELSEKLGSNHLLVQGAGGNTSIKDGNVMWIKASGSWLSEAKTKDIFVAVNHSKILSSIEKFDENPLKDVMIKVGSLRPSIETTLHALMSHKVVLHSHPIELLAFLVLKNGQNRLEKLLKNENFSWVDYIRPGIELTHASKSAIKEKKDVNILLLGNHGLVVGGDDCFKANILMQRVLDYCKKSKRKLIAFNSDNLKEIGHQFGMRLPKYQIIHSLALDKIAYKYCDHKNGILYPDQAVFLGPKMPCFNEVEDSFSIDTYMENNNSIPFIIIKGKGVLVSKNASPDVDEILRCHAELLMRIDDNEKLRYLSDIEVDRLLDWEPEKYRQTIT